MNLTENLKISVFHIVYSPLRLLGLKSITFGRIAEGERSPAQLPSSLDMVLKAGMVLYSLSVTHRQYFLFSHINLLRS